MQPCSRDMQAMNSLLNITQQIPPQDHLQINGNSNGHQQIQNPQFDPTPSHDDYLEQMLLSTLPSSCSWSDLKSPWDPPKSDETGPPNPDNNVGFHYDEILASKLRHHQINPGGGSSPATAAMKMMMQQEIKLAGIAAADGGGGGGLSMPLSLPSAGGEGSVQALYNDFGAGSLHGTNIQSSNHQPKHFHHPQGGNMQAQKFGATASGTAVNQSQASGSTTGGTPAQPKQRVRARRGQATDPHSIAERLRRERIAERMKALQELVPNANRTDKASMLDEIIDYVKFLQLQVKVLSMSRLGGAGAAVAPLVAERGGDCIQTSANGGSVCNGKQTSSTNDGLTVTEHQVAKLMEEDMGSAMQYLQGKGLCLMPISLATAISTSACHSRNPPLTNNPNPNNGSSNNNKNNNHHTLLQSSGEGPPSPSMSVLTVQSATMGTGVVDGSISKP